MSSIKEIAQFVGISSASVSLYLNNRSTKRVSAATKAKIDEAVRQLNYHKNIFASSLSSHQSKLIGIIIPSKLPLFANEYTNALLTGVQSQLSVKGYGMLFFPSSAESSVEIVQEQLERSVGCDGYVLFSTGFCTMRQIMKNIVALEKTEKSFVTLNIPWVDEPIRQVLMNDLQVCSGTRYLIGKGHRNIVLLLGRIGGVHAKKLALDHEKALQDADIIFDPGKIVYGEYDAQTAYLCIKDVLQKYPDTTAICSMSDIMAASAMLAARDLGYGIPSDISIIGRNNSLHSRLTTPLLTTIDLHMEEAGQSAANLILDAIGGSKSTQKLFIPGTLIERETVKTIP